MHLLSTLLQKVAAGSRITADEALLLSLDAPLGDWGDAAHRATERHTGSRVFFNINRHINPTNLCAIRCRFCGFRREPGSPEAFTLPLEEISSRAAAAHQAGATEIHITGGLHPQWTLHDMLAILQAVRGAAPHAALKAFTAVEIDHFAQKEEKSHAAILESLRNAGLESLTGGGAEIFAPEVRQRLCPEKISAETWLSVHRTAHHMGIRTTCTMLYGLGETHQQRIDHLLRLRTLQDETGGFLVFVPLLYQPWNPELTPESPLTAADSLRVMALARSVLDNFPHIKAYWAMLGIDLAQMALHFGANDLDGTVVDERIARMAGGTAGAGISVEKLRQLIRNAGKFPQERDTLYRHRGGVDSYQFPEELKRKNQASAECQRMDAVEALDLLRHGSLHELGRRARAERNARHSPEQASFLIDRNINYTNQCAVECRFCAFHRPADHRDVWLLTHDEILAKAHETETLGGTGILLQGGVHDGLTLEWFEELFRTLKCETKLHIHALSAMEVVALARRSSLGVAETLNRLAAAGLDSMPGAGAEILVDDVRRIQSPHKISTEEWLATHLAAHRAGLPTTATMMFGSVENDEHIVEHLQRIRDLQDISGGFCAFIPWTFQAGHTALERDNVVTRHVSPVEYLRVLAVSRLFLDNISHIQGSRVTMGAAVGQTSLLFGANDIGSIMIEENVVAAAGVSHRTNTAELRHLISAVGLRPFQRDSYFRPYLGQPQPAPRLKALDGKRTDV